MPVISDADLWVIFIASFVWIEMLRKLEVNALIFYFSFWKKCRNWGEYLQGRIFFWQPSFSKTLFTWGFILLKMNLILQCNSFNAIASYYWNEFHFGSQDWNEIHFGSLKLWCNASFISGWNENSCNYDLSFHWILFVLQSRRKMYAVKNIFPKWVVTNGKI